MLILGMSSNSAWDNDGARDADGCVAWWLAVMSIRELSTVLRVIASGLPVRASMYVYLPIHTSSGHRDLGWSWRYHTEHHTEEDADVE